MTTKSLRKEYENVLEVMNKYYEVCRLGFNPTETRREMKNVA